MDISDQDSDLIIDIIFLDIDIFFSYVDTFVVVCLESLYYYFYSIVRYNSLHLNQETSYVEFVLTTDNLYLLIIFVKEPYCYFTEYVELTNLEILVNAFVLFVGSLASDFSKAKKNIFRFLLSTVSFYNF